jgi:6-phosphogluconolactonase
VDITSFRVVDDPSAAGAQEIADALSLTGSRTLALSRGRDLFRHLAAGPIAWERIDVFQVDERVAAGGSEDRNLTAMADELRATIHPMPVGGDLDWGAAAYAATLSELCGSPPVLDVVHLGLGPDGHTASLVPGDPVLDVREAWVAVTETYQGFRRMTMTYPVLDAARCVVIVAAGAEKARAVAAVRNGETWAPAARLASADVRLIVDASAAGNE